MTARYDRPFFTKTIEKILSQHQPAKPFMTIFEGKILYGTKSTHLSPSGVRYNRLVRLMKRLHSS